VLTPQLCLKERYYITPYDSEAVTGCMCQQNIKINNLKMLATVLHLNYKGAT